MSIKSLSKSKSLKINKVTNVYLFVTFLFWGETSVVCNIVTM